MFRTIVAAVADPQAPVQVAAVKAAEIALLTRGRVVLYHAAYDATLSGRPFFDTARLARVRAAHLRAQLEALEALAAGLPAGLADVGTVVEWQRPPHEGIVRAGMRERADLVVAEPRFQRARKRVGGFSHTDWELVRLCPVPLLFARSAARYRRPVVLAAVDPLRDAEKLSTLDARIVRIARELALATGGDLRLLHCSAAPLVTPPVPDALLARERERTRQLLDRLLAEAGLPKRALLLRTGVPADAIEAVVEQEDVGVLVLGSMTRGRIGRLVLGSTAEKLLHTVACDLLVVKPTGFRSSVTPATRDGRGLLRGARRMAGSAGSVHD
jgi:universal stress protein E